MDGSQAMQCTDQKQFNEMQSKPLPYLWTDAFLGGVWSKYWKRGSLPHGPMSKQDQVSKDQVSKDQVSKDQVSKD